MGTCSECGYLGGFWCENGGRTGGGIIRGREKSKSKHKVAIRFGCVWMGRGGGVDGLHGGRGRHSCALELGFGLAGEERWGGGGGNKAGEERGVRWQVEGWGEE